MTTVAAAVRQVPPTVVAARVLLALVSISHLAFVLFTLTHIALLRQEIAADRPTLDPVGLEQSLRTAVTLALAVHLPLFVLTGLLAVVIVSGHPWALRPATVSQLFGIAFSTISTPPYAELQLVIPVVVALEAAVVLLLWAPRRSREFFGEHPKSRRSRRAS